MKLTLQSSLVYLIAAALLFSAVFLFIGQPVSVRAGAGELPATVATTSLASVSTTAVTVFATSTCGARIISTTASPIMITFSDNQGAIPTALFGTLQAASTSVAYSNSLYGCGAYKVYSFAAQNITVMESR